MRSDEESLRIFGLFSQISDYLITRVKLSQQIPLQSFIFKMLLQKEKSDTMRSLSYSKLMGEQVEVTARVP